MRENLDKKKRKVTEKLHLVAKFPTISAFECLDVRAAHPHTSVSHFRPNNKMLTFYFIFCFKNFVWLQAGKKTKKTKKPKNQMEYIRIESSKFYSQCQCFSKLFV